MLINSTIGNTIPTPIIRAVFSESRFNEFAILFFTFIEDKASSFVSHSTLEIPNATARES